MSQNSILEIKELSKRYDAENILDRLSFDVQEGEFLAIVGESGTGKSSLLRIMSGYLDADAGEVIFEGDKLEGPADRLVPGYEEIQLVHQQFDLHPYMSAEENIKRPLLSFTKDYQQTKLDELLNLSGLGGKRDKRPHELSGGQQQKLALSTALAVEPTVLLMDEPFSNLDPFSKQIFLKQIKEQTQQLGTTAIFVTHDTRDALAVADRVIVLSEGKIAQEGTPRDVYNHPVNESIARFFGPINWFEPQQWVALVGGDLPENPVGVRPENINIISDGEGIAGVIESMMFNGASTYLTVRIEGKGRLEVLAYREVPQVGSRILLEMPKEHVSYFK